MKADVARERENTMLMADLKTTKHIMQTKNGILEDELKRIGQDLRQAIYERDDVLERHGSNCKVRTCSIFYEHAILLLYTSDVLIRSCCYYIIIFKKGVRSN